MGIIETIRNTICSKHIAECSSMRMSIDRLKKDRDILTGRLEAMLRLEKELKSEIERLKPVGDNGPPEWLDESKPAYKPIIEYMYQGRLCQARLSRPQDIYAPSMELQELVENREWKSLALNKKLRSIWSYIIFRLTYRYDEKENWQFPVVSNQIRHGDCEDGTILFVTLCRIAGVPGDSVFNATGWFFPDSGGQFGHSYAVARMEDSKWYVFETTLNSLPKHPIPFKDSKNYDASFGVSNWKYQGKIIKGVEINETQ